MAHTNHARSGPPATGLALLVALVIGGIGAVVIIVAAFSADNTDASIDGVTATTSQLVDGS